MDNTAGYVGPKILFLDIETAPMRSFIWKLWKQDIGLHQVEQDWYILCWAAKWAHSNEIISEALIDFEEHYDKNPEDDSKILPGIWNLLNEADIVVTHNGDNFDLMKLNARFIIKGFMPPSMYKSVDTLKIAKQRFGFTSNKLDYIAKALGLGQKLEHSGFSLWVGCLDGDWSSWETMIKYNEFDVVLLEAVYKKLRPWTKSHPNYGLYVDDAEPLCPACGSDNLVLNGYAYTTVSKFQKYVCRNCGKNSRGRKSILDKDQKKTLLTNVV